MNTVKKLIAVTIALISILIIAILYNLDKTKDNTTINIVNEPTTTSTMVVGSYFLEIFSDVSNSTTEMSTTGSKTTTTVAYTSKPIKDSTSDSTSKSTNTNTTTNKNNSTTTTTVQTTAMIVTALPKPEFTYSTEDMNLYTTLGLYIRSKPNSSGNIIGEINRGELVHIIGKCNETGWYEVEYNDIIGYSSNSYFSTSMPEPIQTQPPNNVETNPPAPVIEEYNAHTFSNELHSTGISLLNDYSHITAIHISKVNELRRSVGLPELIEDSSLAQIAAYRAAELEEEQYYTMDDDGSWNTHYHRNADPNSKCCFIDVKQFYNQNLMYSGENLAWFLGGWKSFFTDEELGVEMYDILYNSPPHYKNMTSVNYTHIGVAVYPTEDHVMLVQIFGSY